MQEFDYQLRPRILFGSGFIAKLGNLARDLGCLRALVVSDPGVVEAGLFSLGARSLEEVGIQVQGFHDLSKTQRICTSNEVCRRPGNFNPTC